MRRNHRMSRAAVSLAAICALLVGYAALAQSTSPSEPAELTMRMEMEHPELPQMRGDLIGAIASFNAKEAAFRSGCQEVDEDDSARMASCRSQQASLTQEKAGLLTRIKAFNATVDEANLATESTPVHSPPTAHAPNAESLRVINAMNLLAAQYGWSAAKRAQLDEALRALAFDGDPNSTGKQIRQTWQNILARGQEPDLVREASQGGGLGFPGAGTQTIYNDCAVFALANATGLPYGVVAAQATGLVRDGSWNSATDRANPEAAIENHGLNGGEVVMLTEVFGQAQVVNRADYTKTLAEGHPILLNVVPSDGNIHAGHEVVLTQAFQHGGQTWYVLMDSNQGPQRRLFLSDKELYTMQQENGVVYRPNP